uniref:PARP-type domain-containing protein n=1 Tax=Rhabditophanes sp. KR3021 TaxID=114890 RepID=A0AC35UG80_9BILA
MSRAAKTNRKKIIEISDDELDGPAVQSSSEDDFKLENVTQESSTDVTESAIDSGSNSPSDYEETPKKKDMPVKSSAKKGTSKKASKILKTVTKNTKEKDSDSEGEDDTLFAKKPQNRKRKAVDEVERAVKKEKNENGESKPAAKGKKPDAPTELPFSVEYSKTSKGSCKHCKNTFEKGELKLSVKVYAVFFIGYMDEWCHFNCFFNRAPKIKLSLYNFAGLDWIEDSDRDRIQTRCDQMIEEYGGEDELIKEFIPKFTVRQKEIGCNGGSDCVFGGKIEPEQIAMNRLKSNFHPECFLKSRKTFYRGDASGADGYADLSEDQKNEVNERFARVKKEIEEENQKRSLEVVEVKEDALREQSKTMRELKDKLLSVYKKSDLLDFFERDVESSKLKKEPADKLSEILVSLLLYGVAGNCPLCDASVYFNYRQGAFACSKSNGKTEVCLYSKKNAETELFKVPQGIKSDKKWQKLKIIPQTLQRKYPLPTIFHHE